MRDRGQTQLVAVLTDRYELERILSSGLETFDGSPGKEYMFRLQRCWPGAIYPEEFWRGDAHWYCRCVVRQPDSVQG